MSFADEQGPQRALAKDPAVELPGGVHRAHRPADRGPLDSGNLQTAKNLGDASSRPPCSYVDEHGRVSCAP